MEFIQWLLNTRDFVPRSACGSWSNDLIFLSITGDLLLAVSYMAIPLILFPLWRFRVKQRTGGSYVLLLFMLFIFMCSLTHTCNVVVFWWPAYRLFTMVNLLAGLVSVVTVCVLPPWVIKTLRTPTVQRVLMEVNHGDDKYAQMEKKITELTADKVALETTTKFYKTLYRSVARMLKDGHDRDLEDIRNVLQEASVLLSQIPESGESGTKLGG